MKVIVPAIAASLLAATAALAQTTPAPSTTTPVSPPATTTTPMAAPTPTATPSMSSTTLGAGGAITLTDEQAKSWVDKVVYSSDGKNLGEVAAFARDASGKVTEMHADMGGFLGLGETRVRLMPSQFKLDNDHVTLNMTSEQTKDLPKIAKQ